MVSVIGQTKIVTHHATLVHDLPTCKQHVMDVPCSFHYLPVNKSTKYVNDMRNYKLDYSHGCHHATTSMWVAQDILHSIGISLLQVTIHSLEFNSTENQ